MMKNIINLICCCSIIVMLSSSASAYTGEDNFCFDADVPEAQDNLSVMCLTAPTLFCPPTYLGCPTDDLDPSNTGFPTALPGDASCPTPIVTFTDQVVSNTSCLKIVHRTWDATYPAGSASIKLHSSCQQTLYLEDDTNPTIANCPSNIVVDLSVSCDSMAIWAVPTATDDCGIQLFVTSHFSGTMFPQGTTPVTYTATDHCGNTATCTFDVSVIGSCCAAPTISCPADYVTCPVTGDISPSTTGTATAVASSTSCPNPSITYNDVTISSGPCNGASVIERTWTATDPGSSTGGTSCTQTITVQDNTNPVITNAPNNITVTGNGTNCVANVTWIEPTATDACNLASWTSTHTSGSSFAEGVTTVVYTAVDNCGNTATISFDVSVVCICNSAPVLTCAADFTSCPGVMMDPSVTGLSVAVAGDPSCGAPALNYTDVVISSGPCAGEAHIQRTWTATVSNNNALATSCTQNIVMTNGGTPVITGIPQNITVTGNGTSCTIPVTWTEPVATDDCGVSSFTSTHTSGAVFNQGTTTVSYTAVDACGQAATSSFTVTVNCSCNSLPIITCPASFTACTEVGSTPSVTGTATAVAGSTNCGTPTVTYTDNVISSGPCAGETTIQRTWIAADPSSTNLSASCVQTITLEDNGGPSITNIPSDITVHGNGPNCTVPVKWPEPTVTDDCTVTNVTSTFNNGDAFPEGTSTVFYMASDNCGNTAAASFNITVQCSAGCTNPPTIVCPTNYSVCAGGFLPTPSVSGLATVASGGGACGTPFLFYSDQITAFGNCAGALTAERTWTAFDVTNGQMASCVQVISLNDSADPVISNMPQDITLDGDANCNAVATWSAPSATDDCGVDNLVSSHNSGDTFGQGATTVTYTATDNCGNVVTSSFTVNVSCTVAVCSTPPTISCPANYAACPTATIPTPSAIGVATAIAGSADCGTPTVNYVDVLASTNACTNGGTYNRIWTASDPSNASLSASCTQVITLEDASLPVITNVPSDIVLEGSGAGCTAVATWSVPTATDNCGLASLTSNHNSGTTLSEGVTTVTYTAVDNCGNTVSASFTITVSCAECNTPPSITCPPNYTACADGSMPGLTETGFAFGLINGPNCTGTPYTTFTDVVVSTGPCAGAMILERTWVSTDPNNKLQSSCVQTISLVDNNAPVFSNVPSDIVVNGTGNACLVPVTWAAPTVTDDCGVASVTSNINSGIQFMEGTTTITYTATDNCGNVSNATFTVTVQCEGCNTPPTISCPADYVTCISGNIDPSVSGQAVGANSGANCTGAPYISYSDSVTSSGPCAGAQVINRYWMAFNTVNNMSASCNQTITLTDSTLPVITNIPGDITVSGNGNGCSVPVTWTVPTATDNCGISSLVSSHNSGDVFTEGTTTVAYTATDNCGQFVSAYFTVTVTCQGCQSAPIISCPTNYAACIGSTTTPSFTGVATATPGANCSGTPYVTFVDATVSNGPCAGASVVNRTWTAYDQVSGLTSNCVQTISLGDSGLPVISNMPNNITLAGSGSGCLMQANWNAPTVTDNCGTATLTSNYTSGSYFSEGTTTVTYTATDACGNAVSGTFTVTVQCAGCNTPPAITCPTNYAACASTVYTPNITGYATGYNNGANCTGTPTVTYSDLITSTGPCAGAKVIQRTWTATNPANNMNATCAQTITLGDNSGPSITNMPYNITVTGNGSNCQAPVSWTAPTATDNCGVATLTSNHAIGSTFNQGNTTVTYTATDACGNSVTASFIVTVNCAGCNTPPAITCPTNYAACMTSSMTPSVTGYATATNNGANCNATPIITYGDVITSTGPCAGAQTLERTWIATDQTTGLNASCVQTITLGDTTPPVFVTVPSNIVVQGTGSGCQALATWVEPTVTDNCAVLSSGCLFTNGGYFPEGVTTVVYTATDNCGNESTAAFTVTVSCTVCTVPPSIVCPANVSACVGTPYSPAHTGYATATAHSSCTGTPVVTYVDTITSTGPCAGAQVISRVWTATDPISGLTSSCTQTITLGDNTPPVITNIPQDITVTSSGPGCQESVTWQTLTVTDNCGVNTLTSNYDSGHVFSEGVHLVECTATDFCNNTTTVTFSVTVVCETCSTAPSITCPDNYTDCPGTAPLPAISGAATALGGEPICEAPVVTYADVIVSSGPCAGEVLIARTWTAVDPYDASLTTSCVQDIHLVDTTGPILTGCPAGIILQGMATGGGGTGTGSGTGSGTPGGGGAGSVCVAIATWTAPNISDNCSTATLVAYDQNGNVVAPGDTFMEGTTTITYVATDACGNETTCTFDIVVSCSPICDVPPIAACPADVTVCVGSDISPTVVGQATGIIYPLCTDVTVTFADSLISSGACTGEGVIERTWTVLVEENAFGASDVCVQTITLEDNTPVLMSCPTDIVVVGESTPVTWTAPTVVDACGNATLTSTHVPGSTFPCGVTTVTYTLVDNCGNVLTCDFLVEVDCTSNSNGNFVNCPNDIVLACTGNGGAVADWSVPGFNSSCGTCTTGAVIPGFIYMGSYNGSQYYCSVSPATWPTAKNICQSNGGFLADVNSAGENNFLASQLSIQSAWIGLTDVNSEGNFEWCNGDPVSYTNWYPGQPNNYNGNQDYCEMLSTGEWNDQYNNYMLEYIMEIPCTSVYQISGPAPGSTLPTGTHTITYGVNDPCGSTATCSFNVIVEACNVAPCNSGGIVSTYNYIESCSFAGFNNVTGNDGGYGNYTNICGTIEPNQVVPINLTPGFGGGKPHSMYWTCWIDFNQDGDFDDNYEFVAYGAGSQPISGTITIPAGIPSGTCTMRVSCKLGGYATDPCEVYQYGETEDYCITVVNGTFLTEEDELTNRSSTATNDAIELVGMTSGEDIVEEDDAKEIFEEVVEEEITEEDVIDIQEVEIKVYPNPVSNVMNVTLNTTDNILEVGLYDQRGIKVKALQKNLEIRTDVSDLTPGMYFIRTISTDGTQTTEKVIIMN